jgi:outer membrane PBP1 activator LpoA protein
LSAAWTGLCASAQPNTTDVVVSPVPAPIVSPVGVGGPGPVNGATAPARSSGSASPALGPIPPLAPPKPQAVRMTLLLPLRSEALGLAAEVVRSGFMAAHEREKDEKLTIAVLETGDAPQDILSGYTAALQNSDIIIGPLSRGGVAALAQSGAVSKPTIALTPAESNGETETVLPQKMLMMGLSIEEQARQVADWARSETGPGRAFVLSTGIAWQQRAARAFGAQWKARGREFEVIELIGAGGFFDARGLSQLKKRIQAERPVMLFVALDAAQARQVREVVGNEAPIYGTAQLNPYAMRDWQTAERMTQMNGVRLIDMPWQLQPDHTAVMVYPRLVIPADQKRSPDLERLFALGIDAYRVAREIALGRPAFELDGVTGRLKVGFGLGPSRFQRIEPTAVYKDGMVVPLAPPQ